MIVYKDKDIAVCVKPYGVSSQESGNDNMIARLKDELLCPVYPVHRLDTTTTGLIVYALNQKSAAALSRTVADGKIEKEYLAIVNGECEESGELTDILFHDKIKNKSFVVSKERKGAKTAHLAYKKLDSAETDEGKLSLVRIRLFTGRTHQIRVQLANVRCPLYGDGKYGARNNGKIHLHSAKLTFPHPATGKNVSFASAPYGDKWDLFKTADKNPCQKITQPYADRKGYQ